MYNGTCADYLDSSRATNVPCSAPVVISGEYLSNYRNCNISHHSETQRTVLRLILIGCSKIRGPMCCAEEPKTRFVQLTLTNTLAQVRSSKSFQIKTFTKPSAVNNATYMCTKVQEVGSGAITSGCYTQSVEGYDIDLCVCKSDYGLSLPCNGKF